MTLPFPPSCFLLFLSPLGGATSSLSQLVSIVRFVSVRFFQFGLSNLEISDKEWNNGGVEGTEIMAGVH